MPQEPADKPPVVWVSRIRLKDRPRLALSECPVSYISGESWALLEDFWSHLTLSNNSADLHSWPARRVDAFALLGQELRETEGREDG